jgi:hypothetical protein
LLLIDWPGLLSLRIAVCLLLGPSSSGLARAGRFEGYDLDMI